MAKTKFYKTTLFKCLVSLLAIALIASGLLAVLNDLLYVDPAERTARALKKLYKDEGKENITYVAKFEANDTVKELSYDGGTIDKVYVVEGATDDKYDVLIHATGLQGYKGGTITLWIRVAVDENATTEKHFIKKVIVDDYKKQTLMSRINKNFLGKFEVDITDKYDKLFTMENASLKEPVTGATKSGNAVCNAVNCALAYMGTWGGKA